MSQGIQSLRIPKEQLVAKILYANTMELEGMDSMEIKTLLCALLSGRGPYKLKISKR